MGLVSWLQSKLRVWHHVVNVSHVGLVSWLNVSHLESSDFCALVWRVLDPPLGLWELRDVSFGGRPQFVALFMFYTFMKCVLKNSF